MIHRENVPPNTYTHPTAKGKLYRSVFDTSTRGLGQESSGGAAREESFVASAFRIGSNRR